MICEWDEEEEGDGPQPINTQMGTSNAGILVNPRTNDDWVPDMR